MGLHQIVINLHVTQFVISNTSTGLWTFTNVAQEHLRSDALPNTIVIRRNSNMFERPMLYSLHHINTYNYPSISARYGLEDQCVKVVL